MTIRPLHVVANALPNQVGYTLRTHRLLQAQTAIGLKPTCIVVPEKKILSHHFLEAPCIGIRVEDGIRYGRITEHRLLKRIAVRSTQWLREHNVRGSWKLGQSFELPQDPLEPIAQWATNQPSFNIVHAHTPAVCAIAGRRLADELQCPFIYEVRGFWELTNEVEASSAETISKKLLVAAEREIEIAKSSDAVITLGDTMRDELVRRGVSPERIHVVGNGVDTAAYVPSKVKDKSLIEELEIAGSFVLGCATNVRRLEGLSTVLKALKYLHGKHKRATFILLGDGTDLASLKTEAAQLGVSHMVRFVGRVPHNDVQRYYSLFDAFVLPRIDAAVCRIVTPLKPLEAMAMAIPLVVSDLPALTELLDGGRSGVSFRAEDAMDLAEKLESLMMNPTLGIRMGQYGREWVERNREWKPLAMKTNEIYRAQLNGRH